MSFGEKFENEKDADRKFAVLIDADNVSYKYVPSILEEISNYGITSYKRVYGDLSKTRNKKWESVMLANSLIPVQQYNYTSGKSSTDSAMIIDAMDILYSGNVDGFCIVSSDSDFTRLASRLRESGCEVIGMGENKTPQPFVKSCSQFKYLEIIYKNDSSTDSDEEKNDIYEEKTYTEDTTDNDKKSENTHNNKNYQAGNKNANDMKDHTGSYSVGYTSYEPAEAGNHKLDGKEHQAHSAKTPSDNYKENNVTSKANILKAMRKILNESDFEPKQKGYNMGELYKRLLKIHTDFDVRNFGYSRFTVFLKSFECFEIEDGYVRLLQKDDDKGNIPKKKNVENAIIAYITEHDKEEKGVDIKIIKAQLEKRYKGFDIGDYGYSKLSTFLKDFNSLELKHTDDTHNIMSAFVKK